MTAASNVDAAISVPAIEVPAALASGKNSNGKAGPASKPQPVSYEVPTSRGAGGPKWMKQFVGAAVGAVFPCTYLGAPIWVILFLLALAVYPASVVTWACGAPLFLSLLLPPLELHRIRRSWPMQCLLDYFTHQEIFETSDEDLLKLLSERRVIFTVNPHGVVGYGAFCYALRHPDQQGFPTAVASVLLQLPLLKHLMGIWGLFDASAGSLRKMLQKKSIWVWPGGMAELFASDPREEHLFLNSRKGIIKIAMQSGADILPYYFLGQTGPLTLAKNGLLTKVSRVTRLSVTWMWGRWGLPIPRPVKQIAIRGKPLGIPAIKEPTQEDVDFWHTKFVGEVRRLYETYRQEHPDYAEKPLIIT